MIFRRNHKNNLKTSLENKMLSELYYYSDEQREFFLKCATQHSFDLEWMNNLYTIFIETRII